jgi:hypothetical protein
MPLLLPGDPSLRVDRVATGSDTFRVVIEAAGNAVQAGTVVMETKALRGGAPLLQRVVTTSAGGTRVDSFAVRPATLEAAWQRGTRGGRMLRLEWEGARAGGTIREGDETGPVAAALPSAVFPRDAVDMILAAAPLGEGWRAAWPVYDDARGARRWIWAGVEAAEPLTLADGTVVDAWRVALHETAVPDLFWIARGDGRLLRIATPRGGGATLLVTR